MNDRVYDEILRLEKVQRASDGTVWVKLVEVEYLLRRWSIERIGLGELVRVRTAERDHLSRLVVGLAESTKVIVDERRRERRDLLKATA